MLLLSSTKCEGSSPGSRQVPVCLGLLFNEARGHVPQCHVKRARVDQLPTRYPRGRADGNDGACGCAARTCDRRDERG